MSAAAIADKLNRLGVIAPSEYKRLMGINYKSGFQKKSRAQWSAASVIRILKNRIYIGVLEQGKRVKINYKLDKTVSRPKEEWAVIENNHEAIVSKTDFENVARLMRLDTRIAPKQEKLYLFSGLLFCGACGRIMVRRTVKRSKDQGIYYICSTYNKGQGCSRHSIEERMIEEIVLDAVKRHIAQVEEMDQMFAMLSSMEVNYGDVLANDKEIQAKYNELEKCRRMQLALRKDLLAGIISEEEQIQFGKIYAEREDAIKKSIAALREEMELIFDKGLMVNQWIKNLADSQNISKLNRDIVLNLIEKIIVYEDSRLEIIFKYEDKYKAVCQIVQNFIKEFGEEADSIG